MLFIEQMQSKAETWRLREELVHSDELTQWRVGQRRRREHKLSWNLREAIWLVRPINRLCVFTAFASTTNLQEELSLLNVLFGYHSASFCQMGSEVDGLKVLCRKSVLQKPALQIIQIIV